MLMLATINDDTWNVFNMQHITPNVLNMQHIILNSKKWDYSNIPDGGTFYGLV